MPDPEFPARVPSLAIDAYREEELPLCFECRNEMVLCPRCKKVGCPTCHPRGWPTDSERCADCEGRD